MASLITADEYGRMQEILPKHCVMQLPGRGLPARWNNKTSIFPSWDVSAQP